MLPVGTARHKWDKRLKKSVPLRGCSIMHVVSHIGNNKGEVYRRIEVRERLDEATLRRIETDAFKTDSRTVLADVLTANSRTIGTARECEACLLYTSDAADERSSVD